MTDTTSTYGDVILQIQIPQNKTRTAILSLVEKQKVSHSESSDTEQFELQSHTMVIRTGQCHKMLVL